MHSGRIAARGRFVVIVSGVVAVACALFGCGGASKGASTNVPGVTTGSPAASASAMSARRALAASQMPAPSHRVALVARTALGPFVARSGDAAVAVWMAPRQPGPGQDLIAVPLAADGAPTAEAKVIAVTAQEATTLAVRASGDPRGGWLVAWSTLQDRGEALTVLALARDGAVRGTPVDVARTGDHIRWCDLSPTAGGGVGVWAEESSSGDANVLAIALSPEGKAAGMPVRVARGVDRWQTVTLDDGVGLVVVSGGASGRLGWLRLDGQGQPRGPALAIGAQGTVSSDVDVVALAGGALFAWTDRAGEDAQVMLAMVDGAGHVTGPVPAMNAMGGSSLVALASGPHGAALAWEEPSGRGHPRHALHLASVTMPSPASTLAASPVSAVEVAAGPAPELVATPDGFGVLASAPACRGGEAAGACTGPVVPTFVRFDARLQPVQAEPFVLGQDDVATSLGWGLGCTKDRCFALAATSEVPTPIFGIDLAVRASPFAMPTARLPPPEAPRVLGLATIASGQAFDDVAAAALGDATLVAALASPSRGAGDGARQPARGSTVSLMVLDSDGRARGATQTLTSRGVTTGGIAIAAGGALQDGAAVAWVTEGDDDSRQVHVARLDAHGRRNKEIELTTRARGEVTSVALAWAGDGWLVAWVDGRDGNGEVYASKVDRELSRVAREERITNAPGDAGDVAIAVSGSTAWLAWSDPRESPREGLGDIYATTLRVKDAKRAGDEVRVLGSAPHSRSPQLVPTPDGSGAVVAWIEDAATGLDGPGAAMSALLDRGGHVTQTPEMLPMVAEGRPTAIVLEPSRDGARAVVVRSGRAAVSLDAMQIAPDGGVAGKPWPLLDIEAPASFDVAVALAGDTLVFDDVGATPGDHHVRRAALAWRTHAITGR
jgi:hypothetical protein